MNKKRTKMIYKLVKDKDSKLLKSLSENVKMSKSNSMSGVAIFRWAKRNYRNFGITGEWGKKEII